MRFFLITLLGTQLFFANTAGAYSITGEEFLKRDIDEAKAYLTRQHQSDAKLSFVEYDGSDAVFSVVIDPRCTIQLRVVHTPIRGGIGNGMVTRSITVGDSQGTCVR